MATLFRLILAGGALFLLVRAFALDGPSRWLGVALALWLFYRAVRPRGPVRIST